LALWEDISIFSVQFAETQVFFSISWLFVPGITVHMLTCEQ